MKMKWVKTGPVDKQFQDQLTAEFQEVIDEFFLRRRLYFEEKNRQIDEKILILQGFRILEGLCLFISSLSQYSQLLSQLFP